LKTSQILKQLGILDTATDISTRRPKNAAEAVLEPTLATKTVDAVVQAAEEDEELAEMVERPPVVSVLSKEQAVKLLKPVRGQARRIKKNASSVTQDQPAPEDSLEGKFVDLVDLLPPVPVKGEFDVNKIKSSLYFFS
jgi:DNA-directed RNA polymerase